MDQMDLPICQKNEVNPQPVQGKDLKATWPKYKSEVSSLSSSGHVNAVSLSYV